ncbi:hypothetical protein [Microbacterium sp. NC79]|uniref:hypothetical protein n=1 Tax=Microbacterium sp. NC79 TaxID=2851009 RepID=UPI001C2B90B8|nr:hypothetical protein [Microbacterium sp. NC79]MBV0894059.1 hypothetical protein [Microbacterium sp. NC79]
MSNYIFIFAAERARSRVQTWLGLNGSVRAEVTTVQASPEFAMTVVTHDLRQSLDLPSRTFFKGNLVDHNAGSVVFGLAGWLNFVDRHSETDQPWDGQFLRVNWNASAVTFSRDSFGRLPLLHTQGPGYVAVSDSMLALVDLRKHMGDPITPNNEVLLARSLLGVYGGQQISPETFVEEIGFVPGRQRLIVRLGETLSVTTEGLALDGLDLRRGETYRDALKSGAENIARLMATLMQLGDWKPALSLSGGYDSRVPLAGAIAAGVAGDMQINTQNTQPIHADDYEVARRLAERFNFSLNGKSTAGRLSDRKFESTPFMMWTLSDMGTYDYITRPRAVRHQIKHINLTGLGGEVIRGNYEWRSWAEIVDSLTAPNPLVATALRNQGLKGLEAVGVNANSREASELHYMNYRYALHGGGTRTMQMLGFTPLVQSRLVALAYSEVNELPFPTHYEKSIINDLCIALVPDLAAMPYDRGKPGRESKDLSSEYVAGRLSRLGGPVDATRLSPYHVYGTPDDVPAGPPEFMLNIARRRGLDLPQTPETVLELGRKGLDVLDSGPLHTIYEKVYANALWRLQTKKYSLTGAAKDSPIKPVVLYTLFS